MTKCLIYSLRSVDCCTLDCSELPVLPGVCHLRIYCHLQVLSLSRILFLPGLMSSDSQHVYICGKRLKEILMQISIVSSLFSSLFWLTLYYKLLPLQQTRSVILVSYTFESQLPVNCSRSTYSTPPHPTPPPDHHHTHTHTQCWVSMVLFLYGSHLSRITALV